MNKNLVIDLFIIIPLIVVVIYTGFPNFITSALSQDKTESSELVFSIPIGDNGIHFAGVDNPKMFMWGPTSFTIAPDGTFWIADAPENQLLRFKSDGLLIEKINIEDFVIGIDDLEVTTTDIWLLDIASIPPKIVRLSLDGIVIRTYYLPKGNWLEDGLSGIAKDSDNSILIEKLGGHILVHFTSRQGNTEFAEHEGYEYQGKVYTAFPADMQKEDASSGYILVENTRIEVKVENQLGGLSVIHVNNDGSFYTQVVELVLNKSVKVDQKVYRYDVSGNISGMARVPISSQFTTVRHNIAVGPDNTVYAMITKSDGAEIHRLKFLDELPPILVKPDDGYGNLQPEELSLSAATCRDRVSMISVAEEYTQNLVYINSYHINDNGACPGRVRPSYLNNPGFYPSIAYAWNIWDTVDQFNNYMNGGTNGYFAGNTSTNYLSCGRGIDCSGLVSRAWGLTSHYGTCSIDTVSTLLTSHFALQPGDIMDWCNPPGLGHAVIFHKFGGNGMWGYEAVVEPNVDRVHYRYQDWSIFNNFEPRRYIDACYKIRFPIILKNYMESSGTIPTTISPTSTGPIILNTPYPPP